MEEEEFASDAGSESSESSESPDSESMHAEAHTTDGALDSDVNNGRQLRANEARRDIRAPAQSNWRLPMFNMSMFWL